jgi:hypothetical protein
MDNALFESLLREAELHYSAEIQRKADARREARIRAEIMRQQIILDNREGIHYRRNRHLEVTPIDEIIECPICMETKNNIVITKCKHKFCMDCVSSVKSGKCPYCRQS